MSSNASPIVTQIQADMQALLTSVTDAATTHQTASMVEQTLFRQVLALGLALLRLFFQLRTSARPPAPRTSAGTPIPYHDTRSVRYVSVFGALTIARHSFYAPGHGGCCPVDATMSLPDQCYSDLLREWSAYAATEGSYREGQSTMERILGLNLSIHACERMMQIDAQDVVAFSAQPPITTADTPILVAQADGKGVPMVDASAHTDVVRLGKGQKRTTKKEAIVTALYTIAPYPRSPDDVLAALFRTANPPEERQRPHPVGKELRATLAGKRAAITTLAKRAQMREGPQVQHRVALTDGAEALQTQMQTHLPDYTLVLDIIHATEYLWRAATAVWGETHPERATWVSTYTGQLLRGQVTQVIAALAEEHARPERTEVQRKALASTMGYYQRNQAYMRYDVYLAQGWPIGTGVIEGACRHVVKDRMEQTGMRWTPAGAQAVLDLRAIRVNGDWDAYWQFHRQQQHQRLYGGVSLAAPPETQMVHMAA